MKKKKNSTLPGIILVILGLIFLLDNYGFKLFDFGKLWPMFLIIPGVCIIYDHYKQ